MTDDETRRFKLSLALPQHRVEEFRRLAGDTWHRVEGPDLPGPLLVRLGVTSEGRLAPTGLILGAYTANDAASTARSDTTPPELKARDLRRVPLAEIVAFIASKLDEHLEGESESVRSFYAALMQAIVQEGAQPVGGASVRPGPKGHPREHFERVAAVYRKATADGRSPIGAVMEMGASESTARRWVQRARDMAILGEAIPGKAGERRAHEEQEEVVEEEAQERDNPESAATDPGRASREAPREEA